MVASSALRMVIAGFLCGAVSPAWAAAGDAPAAPATDSAPPTGEILVTALRRSESVLNVPLSISAVSGNALAAKGVTDSVDLAEVVPNLQVSTNFGTAQPNFSMRGISVANEYNSNQVSPVGVYMDDVYLAARASHGMGLFDLDRVEVLRGPQGTLFGRNTTGGAIDFITRGPKLQGDNGYVDLGYGNFNTFTAQGAGEVTTDDGQLGMRAAINYVKGDGQFANVAPGAMRPGSQDTLQGRFSVRFRPTGSGLDIKLRAYAGRDNPTSTPVFGPASARQGLDFFTVNEGNVGYDRTSAWGTALTVSYAFTPGLTATSITSYDGGRLNMQSPSDGTPESGAYAPADFGSPITGEGDLYIHWHSIFRQFTEEMRVNYEAGKLKLVGGVFYGWDRTTTDNDFNIGVATLGAVGYYQHYVQNRYSVATFLQGDYQITPRLSLTLGLRETWDKALYQNGTADEYFGGFLLGAGETPLATTVCTPSAPGAACTPGSAPYAAAGNNAALTGRASLNYKLDEGLLAYASYNRGYRSGAFNGGAYTSQTGIDYVLPERVNAYEVGLKGHLFDHALTFSTAAFYDDYQNQQLQNTLPGPVAILVNAPKSEIYGGELEATWHALPTLAFNGSLGLLHAKYKELTLQGVDLAGQDLPFAPHVTAQAGMDWAVWRQGADEISLSPNLAYTSHVYFTPFNLVNANALQANNELQQNGYTKVNAQLVWKHAGYAVRAWVSNAFNTKVLAYGLDLRGAGFPYNFLVPSTPRTFGVSVRAGF